MDRNCEPFSYLTASNNWVRIYVHLASHDRLVTSDHLKVYISVPITRTETYIVITVTTVLGFASIGTSSFTNSSVGLGDMLYLTRLHQYCCFHLISRC